MLSVGAQELAVFGVVLLFLIVFGSAKFSSSARNLGQLLGGTKRTVEEAKSDLIPEEGARNTPSLTPLAVSACSPL